MCAIQLVRDCCALWWRDHLAHAQANAGLSHWLMDCVCATCFARQQLRSGGTAERCRELIRERLNLRIEVDELAAACGYSRRHFIRRFVAETGMQPGRFIREERLVHGAHLLASTGWTLADIANHCGCASVSSFSRAFTDLLVIVNGSSDGGRGEPYNLPDGTMALKLKAPTRSATRQLDGAEPPRLSPTKTPSSASPTSAGRHVAWIIVRDSLASD